MNYFDILPCEIVDYIYELRHKSMLNNVNNEIKEVELLKIDNYYEQIYIDVNRIVDGKPLKIMYPCFNAWNYSARKNDIINLYNTIMGSFKQEFLDFALLKKIPIYKSWNKGKIVNYLFKHDLIDDFIIYSRPNASFFY